MSLFDAVAARVTAALKAHTGVKPARVIVYDAGKLGTSSEHKASRFIDERGSEVGKRTRKLDGSRATLCSAIGYHYLRDPNGLRVPHDLLGRTSAISGQHRHRLTQSFAHTIPWPAATPSPTRLRPHDPGRPSTTWLRGR